MISDRDLQKIVQSELESSIDYVGDSSYEFEKSLEYYLGRPNGREVVGKSSVTSTDVADAIEWIMPQVMGQITSNNEVVVFDPIDPNDEVQAGIETQFVQDVIMKHNNGFVSLHYLVKDCLMNRNGALKVVYEKNEIAQTVQYAGLTPEQYQFLLSQKNIVVTEEPILSPEGLIDVKVKTITDQGRIKIYPTPIEQLRVAADHDNIDLTNCRFTAHVTRKTISELITEGFDKNILAKLPEYQQYSARLTIQNEPEQTRTSDDDASMKYLDISECYMFVDIDDDGIAEYIKVLVAGADSGADLTILSVEELDSCPWITATGILMSHKFLGLSIYDRIKEIQDQKTALMRNIFDNVYLQNNSRYKVVESMVNLDDLLISRSGGVVRCKTLDAIAPLETPQLNPAVFEVLNYLDQTRAGRVGVSAEGPATPQNIGDRIGSMGVERLMTAKEELVGLIIRVIAETCMKPLCWKIRELARKYMDTTVHVKYMNSWAQTNPTQWQDRTAVSVRVGAGTGNKQEQLGALVKVMEVQEKIMASGAPLTTPVHVFNALNDFCKFSGIVAANRYFVDPNSQEGQQAMMQYQQQQAKQQADNEQQQLAMLDSQVKMAEATVKAADAQMLNVQLKHTIETIKQEAKQQEIMLTARIEQLKLDLQNAKESAKTFQDGQAQRLDFYKHLDQMALEITKLEQQENAQVDKEFAQNKQTAAANTGIEDDRD